MAAGRVAAVVVALAGAGLLAAGCLPVNGVLGPTPQPPAGSYVSGIVASDAAALTADLAVTGEDLAAVQAAAGTVRGARGPEEVCGRVDDVEVAAATVYGDAAAFSDEMGVLRDDLGLARHRDPQAAHAAIREADEAVAGMNRLERAARIEATTVATATGCPPLAETAPQPLVPLS